MGKARGGFILWIGIGFLSSDFYGKCQCVPGDNCCTDENCCCGHEKKQQWSKAEAKRLNEACQDTVGSEELDSLASERESTKTNAHWEKCTALYNRYIESYNVQKGVHFCRRTIQELKQKFPAQLALLKQKLASCDGVKLSPSSGFTWTPNEDQLLRQKVQEFIDKQDWPDWNRIAKFFPKRSRQQVKWRHRQLQSKKINSETKT